MPFRDCACTELSVNQKEKFCESRSNEICEFEESVFRKGASLQTHYRLTWQTNHPMGSRPRSLDIFRRRSLQMNHPCNKSKQRERTNLFDALLRIIRTRRGTTQRGFVYCKIQPTMSPEKKINVCDPNDVTLQENLDVKTQVYVEYQDHFRIT